MTRQPTAEQTDPLFPLWELRERAWAEGSRLDDLTHAVRDEAKANCIDQARCELDRLACHIEKQIAGMEAQTDQGLSVQVRLLAEWHSRGERDDGLDKVLLRRVMTRLEGMIREGAS